MAKKSDPYKTLGVKKTATKEQIKKIYRTRAKKLHPDAGGDADKFAELSRAYALLINDENRARFDETGETETTREDVIRNGAFNIVGNLFISFVSNFGTNWKTKQVRSELLAKLNTTLSESKLKIANLTKDIEFWESVKKDVIIVDDEIDPINTALDEKLRALKLQRSSEDTNIKTLEIAMKFVKKYDFKKAPTVQRLSGMQTSMRTFYEYGAMA